VRISSAFGHCGITAAIDMARWSIMHQRPYLPLDHPRCHRIEALLPFLPGKAILNFFSPSFNLGRLPFVSVDSGICGVISIFFFFHHRTN